jgi:hypothetical protein
MKNVSLTQTSYLVLVNVETWNLLESVSTACFYTLSRGSTPAAQRILSEYRRRFGLVERHICASERKVIDGVVFFSVKGTADVLWVLSLAQLVTGKADLSNDYVLGALREELEKLF